MNCSRLVKRRNIFWWKLGPLFILNCSTGSEVFRQKQRRMAMKKLATKCVTTHVSTKSVTTKQVLFIFCVVFPKGVELG